VFDISNEFVIGNLEDYIIPALDARNGYFHELPQTAEEEDAEIELMIRQQANLRKATNQQFNLHKGQLKQTLEKIDSKMEVMQNMFMEFIAK
jgi:hypothetical protein